MNIQSYLNRINFNDALAPSLASLKALQAAHLFTVPFENLDIHMKRPITLDLAKIYHKIVMEKRGGFCYELNGLFSWLLTELGYDVTLLTARVVNKEGQLGHPFDHLALMVTLDNQRWLVDVGFGYSFDAPLDLDSAFVQRFGSNAYQWQKEGEQIMLRINENNGGWQNRYQFTLMPQSYQAFAPGCHYHQTSSKSSFTQGRLCSQALPNGRITLTDSKFIVVQNGKRTETAVENEVHFRELLLEKFDIVFRKSE